MEIRYIGLRLVEDCKTVAWLSCSVCLLSLNSTFANEKALREMQTLRARWL